MTPELSLCSASSPLLEAILGYSLPFMPPLVLSFIPYSCTLCLDYLWSQTCTGKCEERPHWHSKTLDWSLSLWDSHAISSILITERFLLPQNILSSENTSDSGSQSMKELQKHYLKMYYICKFRPYLRSTKSATHGAETSNLYFKKTSRRIW